MRYLSLAITVICAAMLFISNNPVVLGLCLLGLCLFGLISVFAFAQARIESSAPTQMPILSPKELAALRQQAAAKKAIAAATSETMPSPGNRPARQQPDLDTE